MNADLPGRNVAGLAVQAGRLSAAIAAVGLLGCLGCVKTVSPEARQLLIDSKAAYARGDDETVIRQTTTFLGGHADTNLADVAYYLRGLAKYRRKDTSGAREDLKAAVTATQRKDVRLGALKALGDLAYETGDMAWAESLYGQALKDIETGKPPADEVRYRLGCVLQRRGRWSAADEQFDRVVHVFAGTEIAGRAERRLRCLAWTVQAGAFARQAHAHAEALRLRGLKLQAVARPGSPGPKLYFVVQVGLYGTYEQAAAVLPSVRRHCRDAFITPTR